MAALALALGLWMAGFGDEFDKPNGMPESRVFNENYGAVYPRPAVTTEDHAVSYWVQDIVEDYAKPRVKDAPASLAATELPFGCLLPRPSDKAQVVFVEIYSGYDHAPLYFVTENDVKTVRRHIETKQKRPNLDRMLNVNAAQQVDVFVTEVEQPVYLVLAAHNETIWSLQIAEGARLDGVSIIGYEPQALAHAPEHARVGFAVVVGSPQGDCVETPQQPVNDTWRALQKTNDKRVGEGFRTIIDEASQNHDRFRGWLRWHVGDPHRTIDAYRTAHVLIGPKPATRLRYRPLTGTQLTYTPNAIPVWGSKNDVADIIYGFAENGR